MNRFTSLTQRKLASKCARPFSSATDDVLVESNNNINKVILNRPQAFNAVNLSMIRKLAPLYKNLAQNGSSVVIIKGTGEKAFCAGGDIKAIYDVGKSGDKTSTVQRDFFLEEYKVNNLIAAHKFTQVALLNGITMGGGVGLSVHGQYRVATDNTTFAMPETAIGFFCDVGGSYFLPRLPHYWGEYLGLTGARLKGKDLVVAGVATHFVPADKMKDLEEELFKNGNNEKQVASILNKYAVSVDSHKTELITHQALIEKVFSLSTVEAIVSELENIAQHDKSESNRAWAKKTVDTLAQMSPTSLKVVLEQFRRGKTLSYEECFKMEFRMSQAFMRPGSDFYEGVRAALVDKDKSPKWNPNKISDVSKETVESYFAPLKEEWQAKL